MNKFLLVFKSFLSGFQTTIQKNIAMDGHIFSVLLVRQFFVFLFTLLFFFRKDFFSRLRNIQKRELINIFFVAVLNSVCITLMFFSLLHLPISFVSILEHSIVMFFSVFFGVFLLKERITKPIFFGLLLIIFGILLVLGGKNSISDISILGISLLILYGFLASIVSVLSTKTLFVIDTDVYLFLMYLMRFVFFLPLPFLFKEVIGTIFIFPTSLLILILFIAFLSFLAEFISSFLTRKIPYVIRQITNLLIPCFSAFFGMIWFDGWFSALQFLGLSVVLIGSLCVAFSKEKKKD